MEDTGMMDWRKSSYSNGGSTACVETASDGRRVMVRDTTDRGGITLALTPGAWASFVAAVKK